MTAIFTLIYELTDTAAAPYEIDVPRQDIEPEPEPTDISDEPETTEEPEPSTESEPDYDPVSDGFVTVLMDITDISNGSLILVNHDHGYEIPDNLDLVNIVEAKTGSYRVLNDNFQLSELLIEPLDDMMAAFHTATGNSTVAIISAFRNFDDQQRILNNYISRVGRTEALRWAALPGHSEHHAGLAFDFGIIESGVRRTFHGTGVTAWFRRNSYRFGFILRFPADKTNITDTAHEPWHFRYVGLPHSYIMFRDNLCLEEYIEFLSDYTFDNPFEVVFEDEVFEIYSVQGVEIPIPHGCEFEISGNNIDGFIVTIKRLEEGFW
jgi:D-alanyl-D-alanine carboxypeptidase